MTRSLKKNLLRGSIIKFFLPYSNQTIWLTKSGSQVWAKFSSKWKYFLPNFIPNWCVSQLYYENGQMSLDQQPWKYVQKALRKQIQTNAFKMILLTIMGLIEYWIFGERNIIYTYIYVCIWQ